MGALNITVVREAHPMIMEKAQSEMLERMDPGFWNWDWEEAQLRVILDTSDELRNIYLLKEKFRTICDKIHDRARAERFLWAWMWKAVATGSRYLIRFVKTLHNWWHEFLNYFDDRVTQGFVEGINRAIRGIINRAFGFRDFDNFRLQVLGECGGT
jgi:transposase